MTPTNPTRRLVLGAFAGLALPALALPAHAANDAPVLREDARYWQRERRLRLVRSETGQACNALYWSNGQYLTEGYREACIVLRDVRANQAVQMDPGLLDTLYGIQGYLNAFGWSRALVITSGYRSAATNARLADEGAAKNSMHLYGKAADITLPGLSAKHLGQVAKYFQQGGVGFYTSRNFVHVDTGRIRSWGS